MSCKTCTRVWVFWIRSQNGMTVGSLKTVHSLHTRFVLSLGIISNKNLRNFSSVRSEPHCSSTLGRYMWKGSSSYLALFFKIIPKIGMARNTRSFTWFLTRSKVILGRSSLVTTSFACLFYRYLLIDLRCGMDFGVVSIIVLETSVLKSNVTNERGSPRVTWS